MRHIFLLSLLSLFGTINVYSQWTNWYKVADAGNGAVYVSFKMSTHGCDGYSYYRTNNTCTSLDKCSLRFDIICNCNSVNKTESVLVNLKTHGIDGDGQDGKWFGASSVIKVVPIKLSGDCNQTFNNSNTVSSGSSSQSDYQNIQTDKQGTVVKVNGNQSGFNSNSSPNDNSNSSNGYQPQPQNNQNNNQYLQQSQQLQAQRQQIIQNLEIKKQQSNAQLANINNAMNGIGDFFKQQIKENMRQTYLSALKRNENQRNDAIQDFIHKINTENYTAINCHQCNGTGKLICDVCNGTGQVNCRICNGRGQTLGSTCDYCNGTGKITCNNCYGVAFTYCGNCDGVGKKLNYINNNSDYGDQVKNDVGVKKYEANNVVRHFKPVDLSTYPEYSKVFNKKLETLTAQKIVSSINYVFANKADSLIFFISEGPYASQYQLSISNEKYFKLSHSDKKYFLVINTNSTSQIKPNLELQADTSYDMYGTDSILISDIVEIKASPYYSISDNDEVKRNVVKNFYIFNIILSSKDNIYGNFTRNMYVHETLVDKKQFNTSGNKNYITIKVQDYQTVKKLGDLLERLVNSIKD